MILSTKVVKDFSGHSRVLKQAKNAFPNTILIVGVCDDESTQKYKGPTVTKEYERYEAVRNCRYVDYILPAASWGPYDKKFMDDNKFDFFAHDDLPSPRGEGIDPSDPNACIFTQLKVSINLCIFKIFSYTSIEARTFFVIQSRSSFISGIKAFFQLYDIFLYSGWDTSLQPNVQLV